MAQEGGFQPSSLLGAIQQLPPSLRIVAPLPLRVDNNSVSPPPAPSPRGYPTALLAAVNHARGGGVSPILIEVRPGPRVADFFLALGVGNFFRALVDIFFCLFPFSFPTKRGVLLFGPLFVGVAGRTSIRD